jgi:hypothetical protein
VLPPRSLRYVADLDEEPDCGCTPALEHFPLRFSQPPGANQSHNRALVPVPMPVPFLLPLPHPGVDDEDDVDEVAQSSRPGAALTAATVAPLALKIADGDVELPTGKTNKRPFDDL